MLFPLIDMGVMALLPAADGSSPLIIIISSSSSSPPAPSSSRAPGLSLYLESSARFCAPTVAFFVLLAVPISRISGTWASPAYCDLFSTLNPELATLAAGLADVAAGTAPRPVRNWCLIWGWIDGGRAGTGPSLALPGRSPPVGALPDAAAPAENPATLSALATVWRALGAWKCCMLAVSALAHGSPIPPLCPSSSWTREKMEVLTQAKKTLRGGVLKA
mmetsp:Transcript_24794/g.62858  ORF Transcript_24794/g.62858 Transcript_24794/m.62858 type:complete len:219 (+) Transcript_24794:478-1134(+)